MNPISVSVILNEVKNPRLRCPWGARSRGFFASLLGNMICKPFIVRELMFRLLSEAKRRALRSGLLMNETEVARASRPWARNTGGTPVPLKRPIPCNSSSVRSTQSCAANYWGSQNDKPWCCCRGSVRVSPGPKLSGNKVSLPWLLHCVLLSLS